MSMEEVCSVAISLSEVLRDPIQSYAGMLFIAYYSLSLNVAVPYTQLSNEIDVHGSF